MPRYEIDGPLIHIETDRLRATVRTEGYVSGVMAGTLEDKETGATDLGFGLAIVDFLLTTAERDEPVPGGQYDYGNLVHGDIPKRYVEGPQICTQAGRLPFEVVEGDGFLVVKQRFQWTDGYAPYRAGSRWEQKLVFADGLRYLLADDRVTTVNAVDNLFLRIDMPGHLRHDRGDTFEQIYLSYHGLVPSSVFAEDFPPDGMLLYRRPEGDAMLPERFIRAYQVRLEGEAGPWLAGMTLEPSDVWEAWCHQRGYVCLIEEIGGRAVRPGDTFGACYAVGWFDDLEQMHAAYDERRGWSGIALEGPEERPTGFRGLSQDDLEPAGEPI